MKLVGVFLLLAGHGLGHAARLDETPMAKVVTLLGNMKTKIEATGTSEQASYDKYACFCEDTLGQKASDITKAKDKIEELQTNIVKNKGALGSGGATIKQLNKDIAENVESTKEAEQVRNKEHAGYAEERREAEQCIGALEAGIKVLSGAGSGKKGFLQNLQEAQLLSVAGGMRQVVKVAKQKVSDTDLQLVEHFVEKPDDFFKGSQSALQVGNNPFGDYAPQSTQIQGILKNMYDSFAGDLERDNSEEAQKQKGFEALMSTKRKELSTLQGSLESQTKTDAEKNKQVADDKSMLDQTKEQLSADEEFFGQTKESCATKSKQWAQRTRLRTQELHGIAQAVEILGSDKAKATFKSATKMLIQTSSVDEAPRKEAYRRLSALASQYHSLMLAQIASAVKTNGHFDDIIVMVDKMIGMLRNEAKEDIAHRDRCEEKQSSNKNTKEDAEHDISKAEAHIKRLETSVTDKEAEVKAIEDSLKKTQKNMDDMTTTRTAETAEFKKAAKDDTDSIALLEEAEAALGKFYKDAGFLQKAEPNTNWEGGDYKGSAGEATGVMAILGMLKEDLHKEIKSGGQEEVENQVAYEKAMASLTEVYRASKDTKIQAETELAEMKVKKADVSETKASSETDLDNEKELSKAIATDCDWVETHFEKRSTDRKAEMDGLVEAKEFLAGVGTANDLSLPP